MSTGSAAAADMTLYGVLMSPFAMRCVLVARAKGHELPVSEFEGGIKSPGYLAMNPVGKLPVLRHGDVTLFESAVVAEYLAETLQGPDVLGADPAARARARLLARVAELYALPGLVGLFRAREAPEGVPGSLAAVGEGLGYLEAVGLGRDEWAAGPGFTIADAALMPMFFFLEALSALGTARLLDERPGVAGWWGRAKASQLGERMMAEMGAAMKAFMKR